MDPASLALGVLPVVGGAIQAYRSLQKTFKAYCHYSRDVRRLRKHFNREEQFFLNETQLLIRPAGDDDAIVECMIGDSSHPSWLGDDLEKRLRKYLGKSYNVWQGILEDVNAEIETFKAKLQCFDEIALQRQMVRILGIDPVVWCGVVWCVGTSWLMVIIGRVSQRHCPQAPT